MAEKRHKQTSNDEGNLEGISKKKIILKEHYGNFTKEKREGTRRKLNPGQVLKASWPARIRWVKDTFDMAWEYKRTPGELQRENTNNKLCQL